ncbi:MAG: hypothetical protein ALECFALPRED_008598 [Alectoria fallacina]|uniref:BRCT domain-containing protein n=1 Tax=Alectoria fallacina TaxID=1903189 RepID=A0A8H3I5X8_9LECA|nr:MAG: hypothetical protein ALECFALPRED_008598 [Alectoria fallacina]
MGAIHKFDLTSDVTHLIVGASDTPKYKFVAKERPDVKCLLPGWIDAVRASWMEGGETDVDTLEITHRLPTLTGLKVCVTGFDDLIYRKELEDRINDNGGDYRCNLTKDVTHLIAKEPSGAKYSYAGQWGIKIVSVEWLEQSLERGMILDETLYNLLLPPLERGRNAWTRKSFSTTFLGKRARDDEVIPPNARKLRRTASARLSSHNDGLWSEINGGEVKAERIKADAWDEPQKDVVDHRKSLDAAQADTAISAQAVAGYHTLKRSQSVANLSSVLCEAPLAKGLFYAKTFLLRGFDEKKIAILEEHLRSHGAQIIDDASQLPPVLRDGSPRNGYILIPHTTSELDLPQISENDHQPVLVTDMWVERCLYRKQFEKPQASITSTPFRKFPIASFEDLAICSTGFRGIDLVHMSKAVKLMGAKYDEFFTPKASVLLCNAVTPGHEKLLHAQLWGIPSVEAEWLWDCIRRGESMPFGPYLVQPLRDPSHISRGSETLILQDKSAKSRKNETTLERNDMTSRRPTKKLLQPMEEDKNLAKDTLSSGEQVHIIDPDPCSTIPTRSPCANENQLPDMTTTYDTTMTAHINLDDESLRTLRPTCGPLHEISPNASQPKPSTSPEKLPQPSASAEKMPSPQKPDSTSSSSLGPAISSLLARHQRASTNPGPSASSSSEQPRPYRRQRRQLLGRAPSNLSSHSINLSRASSIDTMNTDGLGTPLEPSNITKSDNTKNNKQSSQAEFKPLWSADQEDPDREEPPLQMTQLGYEDETVKAWRERVDVKMGVGYGKVKGKGTPGKGKPRDVAAGGLGISKRTRLASGR